MPGLCEPAWRTASRRHRILTLLLIAAVTTAIVAALVVAGGSRPDRKHDAQASNANRVLAPEGPSGMGMFDPAGWAGTISDALEAAAKRMCSPQYDYPGCTSAQQASLEAPDGPTFRKNYDKGRWGQHDDGSGARAQWNNLTDANNDKMRQLYADAVQRYESKMRSLGFTGKRAQATYQTWGGFRNNMDCGGSFGWYSGLVNAWCLTQKPINWIVDGTQKVFLNCDTLTLTGAFTTGLASSLKWAATTIKVGSMQGAALAAVGCTVQLILDMIQDALGGKAKQPDAVADALAALDGRARGQAAVVTALRG
jgi:hypothetical protein